jgi:hypothetical protein
MPYRVVQWATGSVGSTTLKAILEHPDLELAGLYVYSAEKKGRDAGELVGLAPCGVLATSERDEILALDADIVVHTPRVPWSVDELDADVLDLLRAGKNVVSVAGYAAPHFHGSEYVAKLQAACEAGGATLFGTGIDPDIMLGRVPATLTGLCLDVEKIRISEMGDMAANPNVSMMVDTLMFGKDPDEMSFAGDGPYQYLLWYSPELLAVLARSVGVELEDTDFGIEFEMATHDFEIPATKVRKGTIAGFKATMNGYWKGDPFIEFNCAYWVQPGLPDYPTIGDEWQWTVDIVGNPGVKATLEVARPVVDGRRSAEDPCFAAVAAAAIRSIPAVVAAPPGLLRAPIFAPWTPRMG